MTVSNDSQDSINAYATRGLAAKLGIEIIELTPSRVRGTMPVDERTRQPYGLLHGGASVAFAESLASIGAVMNIDRQHSSVVALEINANHIRAKREGTVRGTALPIHIGRSTQVWTVEIRDEDDRIVCISRCTIAVIPTP
jgi:1,4-dihydroxy-2-naphthoyl-CoA hydrolase